MQIQEAATQLGVSERSLRHYEAMGLLRPRRIANGYRDYSAGDLERAAWLRDLVELGFSLRELRTLATLRPPPSPAERRTACTTVLARKLSQVESHAAELKRRRTRLRTRLTELDYAPTQRKVSR